MLQYTQSDVDGDGRVYCTACDEIHSLRNWAKYEQLEPNINCEYPMCDCCWRHMEKPLLTAILIVGCGTYQVCAACICGCNCCHHDISMFPEELARGVYLRLLKRYESHYNVQVGFLCRACIGDSSEECAWLHDIRKGRIRESCRGNDRGYLPGLNDTNFRHTTIKDGVYVYEKI